MSQSSELPESSNEQIFDGELYELASNYPHIKNVALDVPRRVSDALGKRGYVPVTGTVDEAPVTTTLVPVGGGHHRLFLNSAVRAAIGKGPGDRVQVTVRFDPTDRMPEVPADLQSELKGAEALDAWAALTPSRRKELLVYLADAKRDDTRSRRIKNIVDSALHGPT